MAAIMKIGIIIFGIIMLLAGFWFHSVKMLTVNFALYWTVLGAVFVLSGAVLPMQAWSRLSSVWQGILFLCLGGILFIGGFAVSVILSQLITQNRELAMQVALLMENREQMEMKLGEESKDYEKTAVGY